MSIEIRVPALGESIRDVDIGQWKKKAGDWVSKDETLLTVESEKATVDLPSPADGVLVEILRQPGETAKVGEVIARIDPNAPHKAAAAAQTAASERSAAPSPAAAAPPEIRVTPSARRLVAQHHLRPEEVTATGPGGRVLKEDVQRRLEEKRVQDEPPREPAQPATAPEPVHRAVEGDGREEVVPMSRLRRTIAARLVEAQRNAALLTTFSEIDCSEMIQWRKHFGEIFQQKHQVKLGFMSFFVTATVEALKEAPQINAEIRGQNIVYHRHYDIGVAIGGGKGLVVPVLRNAERMSAPQIELAIADFARRAQENTLSLEELQGGTFTISNGGVYGSLLSTPIINPPQSGVLGLHAIQERPVAIQGQVAVRPMMYVALTYDHRLVDGREAVAFLKRIKETIEHPARLYLGI